MNPGSGDIDDALRNVRTQLRNRVVIAREGKTQLETLIDKSQTLSPPGLDLPSDVRLPASLVFRDASVRDVFTVIARFANVNIVFEPTFRDDRITIDLSNVTLDQALAACPPRRATSTRSRRSGPSRSSPTPPPSAASTRRKSSARFT
jgi:hypothetical protein